MTDALILHHYDFSNFSEKVRLVLGLKGLAWHGVEIPEKLPKPDYLPLTAGYRRAPALQIGADIWCDTALIVEQLERLAPAPTLYPGSDRTRARAHCQVLAAWAESALMRPIALYITGLHADRFDDSFHADRAALHGKPVPDAARVRAASATYEPQALAALALLEDLLADAAPWILDDAPSLADIALYQAPWFLRVIGGDMALPRRFTRMRRWAEAVAAIGHGEMLAMDAATALDRARQAQPAAQMQGDYVAPEGVEPGDDVVITPFTERSPARGELICIDDARVVIGADHPRSGRVHVHFPRLGYRVTRAAR